MTRNQAAADVEASLAQQLAALYIVSLSDDVPRWFADGVGFYTAKKLYKKNEEMKSLDDRAEEALAAMVNLDDFVNNRMPAHQAALVSYLFVKQMKSKSGSFNKLVSEVKAGKPFESSFKKAFGKTPSALLGGVQEKSKRRR